jgi:PAS domain S-box-containing protein
MLKPFKTQPGTRRTRGLAAYLALAFSLLSVLFTLILVALVERDGVEEVKTSIGHGLAELAMQTTDKLDRGMFERYREVGLLAQRTEMVSRQAGGAARRRLLDTMKESYGYYEWIGIAGLDGKVEAATGGLLEGADISKRPWFRNALNGVFVGDVHEAVLLAKLLPATSEPRRFVDVAFPYRGADGSTEGVIATHLSWTWAHDVERSIMAAVAKRGRIDALIVDAGGRVLLGPAALQGKTLAQGSVSLARGGASGYQVEQWPDGREYLVGYAKSKGFRQYPGLGWTVLVRQDLDNAYEPVHRLRQRALVEGIALALLFSLAGVLAASRITRPLWELARSAQRMQQGEAVALDQGSTPYFEVQSLRGSLNALVADLLRRREELQQLNATLEQRVEERTRALEEALHTVRASEQRIASIIEASQDAFVAVDLRGAITDWNSQAGRMFGWRRDEVLGKPAANLLVPERFRQSVAAALELFSQTGDSALFDRPVERIVADRHGKEFPVEVTLGLAGGLDTAFFSVFIRDISERKKIERMKSEFVATVSHELRTPLTSIRASLSMLAEGIAGELPADIRSLVDIANQSCERLVRLVNDVLDIQKIESGNMEFHRRVQPLLPLAEQAVACVQGYARQEGVALACQAPGGAPLLAEVDSDRITQVIVNLLSNAIKFSERGQQVSLRLERSDGRAKIYVEDQGCGIPAGFHDRVFQPFAQADSADSRQQGGTGLGLSICKSIVEQHGGTISFTSAQGKGTCFVVQLPLAQAA